MNKPFLMNSKMIKDKRKRFLFCNLEVCFLSFDLLSCINFSSPNLKRVRFAMNNQTLNRSLTSIDNKCLLTGKSSTLQKFRLSKITLRKAISKGLINGIRKSC